MKIKRFLSFALTLIMCLMLVPMTAQAADVKVGDTIQFGSIGGVPISWQVLEAQDGKVLILSEKVLEMRLYHESTTDVTWETSSLRQYLNGDFYNNTFTDGEMEQICLTHISNNDNQYYKTDGGNDTEDKIFVLSLDEVIKHFGGESQPNDNDSISDSNNEKRIAQHIIESENTFGNNYGLGYWLRSPGYASLGAATVSYWGTVSYGGCDVGSMLQGVRPAMWINAGVSAHKPTPVG